MIEWKKILESYPCETCGAAPGNPCITISGLDAHTPHQWRTSCALANDWRYAWQASG